jgi:phosphoglycerate-specific signal transduction histidine kinase
MAAKLRMTPRQLAGRDITEEKAAEAELVKAQEALRQSQKMEAIGHIATTSTTRSPASAAALSFWSGA